MLVVASAPLAVSCQSSGYDYHLFEPEVSGPRSSDQHPSRFFDNRTYIGLTQYQEVDHDGYYKNAFVNILGTFQKIPRVYGHGMADSRAIDSSRGGHVVGYDSHVSAIGESSSKVWTWTSGVSTILPSPSGFYGFPEGIADNGDVAGWMYKGASYQAVAWLGGQFTELESGGLSSICRGVDASGAMYGNVVRAGGSDTVPVVWRNGVRRELTGFDGYTNVNIQRVSRGGAVAGYLFDPAIGKPRMFVLVGGKLQVMAPERYKTYGLSVVDVNDNGMILARNMYDSGVNLGEAFVIYRDGVGQFWQDSYTLNTTYVPWRPTAINNRGEIIGIAHASGIEDSKLFIATPVPEPASLAALALGLSWVTVRRRRQA